MMNDDGDCWWVEEKSVWGRRTGKGRNAVASRDMQTAKRCSQATFFFPPPPDRRNLYRAAYAVQCGASRARIECPNRDSPVCSCILSKRDSMFSQLTCRYTGITHGWEVVEVGLYVHVQLSMLHQTQA